MKKTLLIALSILAFTQFCSAQQTSAMMNRVGDAYRGHIQQVKSEAAVVRIKDGVAVEQPRVLMQIVNYSEDSRRREIESYNRGTLSQKTINTYLPDGQEESMAVYAGDGTLISKREYEHDPANLRSAETQFRPDGSIKEKKTSQRNDSANMGIVTKSTGTGTSVETSINTKNYSTGAPPNGEPKRSVWTTTKPDGSRTENIFEVDANGTHNDQQVTYSPDGSLTGKRISLVNADVTRLEATEYDASGNITKRTLQTRDYDSQHNINKSTEFRWNPERKEFEPFVITYNTITYYR